MADADLATLEGWLADCYAARHKLLTGTKAVEVMHGDMRNKFEATNVAQLSAYIERLSSQIAALGGSTASNLRRRMFEVNLGKP
jgi:gpW